MSKSTTHHSNLPYTDEERGFQRVIALMSGITHDFAGWIEVHFRTIVLDGEPLPNLQQLIKHVTNSYSSLMMKSLAKESSSAAVELSRGKL